MSAVYPTQSVVPRHGSLSRLRQSLRVNKVAYRNDVHPDEDFDRVVRGNPLLDSQLPTVLSAGILGALVDAEGALERQSMTQ